MRHGSVSPIRVVSVFELADSVSYTLNVHEIELLEYKNDPNMLILVLNVSGIRIGYEVKRLDLRRMLTGVQFHI